MHAPPPWLDRFARFVTGRPWRALALSLLLVAGLAAGLVTRGLGFNAENRIWFVEGDPTLAAYNRLPELFGDTKFVGVAVSLPKNGAESVFNPETFALVDQISSWLARQKLVLQVHSLTTFEKIVSGADLIEVEKIWPLPARYPDMKALRAALAGDPLVDGRLVSADGKSALIYARVETLDGDTTPYVKLSAALDDYVAKLNAHGHRVAVSGEPMFVGWVQRLSGQDFGLMTPISVAIMALLLGLGFRRWLGVWTPIATVFAAVLGTFGLMAHTGHRLNLVNFALVTILLPVCVAECVHLLNEFFRHYRRGNAPEAARLSMTELFVPFFFTTLTTVVGFLALAPSRLMPMRELGYEAAFGVSLAWLLTLVAFPALLALYRGKPLVTHDASAEDRSVRIALAAARFARRWRWAIVGATAFATVASLALLPRLRAETHNNEYFKAGSHARTNIETVDRILGGTAQLELVIDTGATGGVKDPGFLRRVDAFEQWLAAQHYGARPVSLVDYTKSINEALELEPDPAGGAHAYRYIPGDARAVAQMLLAYESLGPVDSLSAYRDAGERYYRLPVPMPNLRRTEYERRIAAIRAQAATMLPGVSVEPTGIVRLFTTMDSYILDSTLSSFAWSLLPIVLCLFIVLRSLRLGLLAILPNVLPILMMGGALALFDIALDFGISMVAAVVFGIVVDDTIHFLSRLKKNLAGAESLEAAVAQTYVDAGGAIAITTFVIALGFGVYSFSSFVPNMRFGVLSMLVVTFAAAIELFLTPALLFAFPPRLEARVDEARDTLREAA
jgi:uncharacterized protein